MAAMAEEQLLMVSAFPRVLAIDDDADAPALFESELGNLGFEVKTIADGRGAVSAVSKWPPEAILVNKELRGIDGVSLIASLRRITDVPIMVISRSCELLEKVTTLLHGADDFIIKPFEMDELAAYIRARLRRPRMETREIVTYADITIDVSRRKAARAGRPLELSVREFDLLLTLARRPEQVFTRTQLLDLVWGVERDVAPATVETYISYLRSKVDVEGAPALIHTLRGVGYSMRAL